MSFGSARLMTADEFYDFAHRPENDDRFLELERGRVVESPLRGVRHGCVCGLVAYILGELAAKRRKGYPCCNNVGLIVERDPDTVRGPDVMFYEDDDTLETMERKYSAQPPRLVVEVSSPDDQWTKMNRRVGEYLRMGVPLVWVIDSEGRGVTVYRRGRDLFTLDQGEELTGEDVLPDFRCQVKTFFTLPGE
jgi:Uma2 family endonuclease